MNMCFIKSECVNLFYVLFFKNLNLVLKQKLSGFEITKFRNHITVRTPSEVTLAEKSPAGIMSRRIIKLNDFLGNSAGALG